jgi:hypothetical protein
MERKMKAQRQWLKAVKAAVAAAVEQRAVFNKEVRWASDWRDFCVLRMDGARGVGTTTSILMAAGRDDLIVAPNAIIANQLLHRLNDLKEGARGEGIEINRSNIVQKSYLKQSSIGRRFANIWFDGCVIDDEVTYHLNSLFASDRISGVVILMGRAPPRSKKCRLRLGENTSPLRSRSHANTRNAALNSLTQALIIGQHTTCSKSHHLASLAPPALSSMIAAQMTSW